MAISFTEDQQKVIDARHKNVLVSAAAGSGKTAVLVERIVRLVCDSENNTDIDELLVVTFTKAAASEMRERILKRIAEELEKNPASAHLHKQYALVHRAMITTIDSFCQNVLRNHFQDIDLDPDFRVMDEGEKRLMRQDVVARMLEEKYAEGSEEFFEAVEFFTASSTDDSVLEKYILELQEYSESFDRPELFLQARTEDHSETGLKLEKSALGAFMKHYITGMMEGFVEEYRELLRIANSPDGPYMYGDRIEAELEISEQIAGVDSLEKAALLLGKYADSVKPSLSSKKDDSVDPDKREYVKQCRNEAKKKILELKADFFEPSLDKLAGECDACSGPVNTLVELTIEFRRRLQELKREKKVVDFGDLEHYALEILTTVEGEPTPAAEEYRNHFKEIMVDEYQDSNLIQDVILNAIARKEPGEYDRFMVGDVKQSIYGFRQARPDLFLEKYDSYPEAEGCERIDLSKNFRSRHQVLEAVNDVFDGIMHRSTGKIEYDSSARLYTGADYPEAEPGANYDFDTELILLDAALKDELEDRIDESYSANESEAVVIAGTIAELMRSQKVTQTERINGEEIKTLRPLRYSDIVVLHRSPSGMADALSKIFEQRGIPVSISQGKGYFSVTEIQQVLQFLRAINNPLNDIPLYGAMHSVFGGFTDEQIARIRVENHGRSLYSSVKRGAPEFLEKLEKYRRMSVYVTIRELLQRIFDDHGYLDYAGALPGGSRRRANVEKLLSYASDFEKTSYFGLLHFVRYIDLLEKYSEDNSAEADVLGENADVVRFMSIHKSKGLEFPVTILAGMGHGFMDADQTAALNHDNELGIGCEYVDTAVRTKDKTLRHRLIAKKLREDSRAEEMRLLYVAMTRAKEKLIMIGRVKNAQNRLDDSLAHSKKYLNFNKFISSKCMLDFVLPVLADCKIRASVADADMIETGKLEEQVYLDVRRGELRAASEKADRNAVERIKQSFSYEYRHKYLEKLNTKTTVTELKTAAMLDEDEAAGEIYALKDREIYVPEFRRKKAEISGTVIGDSYHRVMEIMDFDYVLGYVCGGRPENYSVFREKLDNNREELSERLGIFLGEMLDSNRISQECRDIVKTDKLMAFLCSNIAYRMWMSSTEGGLYREQPFVLSVSAGLLNKDYPKEESVIIQGIIDAFFEENGKTVLIDYKTDAVKIGAELAEKYAVQLNYYQEAIERLTGKKVAERYLYSFSLDELIEA